MHALTLILSATVAIASRTAGTGVRPLPIPISTPVPKPGATSDTATSTPTDTAYTAAVHPERSASAEAEARSRRAPSATATSIPSSTSNQTPSATPTTTTTTTSTSTSTPSATPATTRARLRQGRWHRPDNLLVGPARCLLRYLEAVRHAGPRPERSTGRLPAPDEREYAAARALTAPRTLEVIERQVEQGQDHPLAPWREAARAHVLESFQLMAVRRAPLGAAVVTVAESFWRPPGNELERSVSEYLVARVHGEWKVVDRTPGQAFEDEVVRDAYAGFFDDPAGSR
jgi:hypothetical protein